MIRRALVVVGLVVAGAAGADARCADAGALGGLSRAVARRLGCERARRLDGSPRPCGATVPACAAPEVERIVQLVWDALPAPGTVPGAAAQRACQAALSRAAARFVTRRLNVRLKGRRSDARARKLTRAAQRACGVDVAAAAGGTIPALAGPCAGLAGPAGGTARRGPLLACLRGALTQIVDDVTPRSLAPNLVLVLTDDQRWDTLWAMPVVQQRLAEDGIEFSNSFVTTALCCPSRASLYSGQYAFRHDVLGNAPPHGGATWFDATSTLPVWLKAAGYRTALFGKYMNWNYFLSPTVPPGWDVWQTFVEDGGGALGGPIEQVYYDYTLNQNGTPVHYDTEYSTDLLRDRVLKFVRERAEEPFFVVYAPFAPHAAAIPAARHRDLHRDLAPWRPPNFLEPDLTRKPDWVNFMASIVDAPRIANLDEFRKDYLASLRAVDEGVEDLLDLLDELGLAEDTLVVFTSDNGLHFHEHWWAFKTTAYEEAIRVPLAIRFPRRIPAPRRSDALALNIDLAPTFAELAGATAPPTVDGRSLVPLLDDPAAPWRDDFYVENYGGIVVAPDAAVRTREWKYIFTFGGHGVTEELYRLTDDPYELNNLAAEPAYADVKADMVGRLVTLRGGAPRLPAIQTPATSFSP